MGKQNIALEIKKTRFHPMPLIFPTVSERITTSSVCKPRLLSLGGTGGSPTDPRQPISGKGKQKHVKERSLIKGGTRKALNYQGGNFFIRVKRSSGSKWTALEERGSNGRLHRPSVRPVRQSARVEGCLLCPSAIGWRGFTGWVFTPHAYSEPGLTGLWGENELS